MIWGPTWPIQCSKERRYTSPVRYSVCIATYRRPEGLAALLESLELQELAEGDELEIVVVDNDPPSASPVIEAFRSTSRHTVISAEQSIANISVTRNAGVAHATGDWVWFVDDDERADPRCLHELISVIEQTNADVAFGDVLPDFEADVPDWMATAPIFARATPIHGADSRADRTGNTLVRKSVMLEQSGPFDEALGKSGGEDSDLFHRLRSAGYRLVETDRAKVWETVPEDRTHWEWMANRSRRLGRLYADRVVRYADGSLADREVVSMLGKAVVQVGLYGAGTLVGWRDITTRRHRQLKLHSNLGKLSTLTSRELASPWS